MINFILDLVIMASLGVLLYIIARTLPRIDENNFYDSDKEPHWLVIYIEKADERFQSFSEKFLRRLRIVTLKTDNYLGSKLSDFKKESGKKEEMDFDFEKDVKNEVDKEEIVENNNEGSDVIKEEITEEIIILEEEDK